MKRFWNKVDKSGDCWEWTGALSHGYGAFGVGSMKDSTRRVVRAHRFSWEEANGSIPDGLCVLHKCDNRSCVNPDHLFVGTNHDNVKDMLQKKRDCLVGERRVNNKLDRHKVRVIRLYGRSLSQPTLAKIFGVTQSCISRVLSRELWGHVA